VTAPCRKAIIVAAGRGRRLGDRTGEIPKCMVEVGGRPILHWQLRALAAAGVDDVVMVRGYLGHRIDPGAARVRFVDNPEWERNNILASLMYAAGEFGGGFYFSYCDIVYAPAAALALAVAAKPESAAASLVVDRRWADTYQGRDLHPISEAELAEVEARADGNRVLRVGKQVVPRAQAAGEFIGLAHFSAGGAAALEYIWHSALASGGLEAPFGRAKSLRQAYLTDALNTMASRGHRLAPVLIDGQWREIDTQQDLAAAGPAMASWAG
jgi:L-glutamine-phosphate cytidylyltransferase